MSNYTVGKIKDLHPGQQRILDTLQAAKERHERLDPRITTALGLPPTASVDEVVGAIERLQDDCGHLKLAAFEACAIGIECGDESTESLRQQVNELIDTCLAREEPNPC